MRLSQFPNSQFHPIILKQHNIFYCLGEVVISMLLIGCIICCTGGTITEPVPKNPIVLQKDSIILPLTPKWDGVSISSAQILNGYTDSTSYFNNDSVKVFINAKDSIHNAMVKLFTVNGLLVDSVKSTIKPQKIINAVPWENGFGYNPTFTYSPAKLRSGIYLWEKKIPIIIKSATPKTITVLYPSNTENAYCESGGMSMYTLPIEPPFASFLRPILLAPRATSFLEWIENTTYYPNINFICDKDMDNFSSIKDSKLLIIIGHSEYWTREARINFDRFVNEGNDVMILSGNTMWWQVRYNKQKNQLICYRVWKDDPITNILYKTVQWTDRDLKFPIINSIGGDFDLGGYGLKDDCGWDGYKICLNNSPLLEGTFLKKGDILRLPSGEYDGTPLKGFNENGYPIADNSQLKFYKLEILGFDFGFRDVKTCGTFMVLKKSESSGIIINGASYDWCSPNGIGGVDGLKIKQITVNMIEKLLNKQNVFSN